MKIIVWGSDISRKNAEADGFSTAKTKEEFFKTTDILSLHLRLVDNTRHIIKLNDLSLMKPEALFVNTSRAELVEENALIKALKN